MKDFSSIVGIFVVVVSFLTSQVARQTAFADAPADTCIDHLKARHPVYGLRSESAIVADGFGNVCIGGGKVVESVGGSLPALTGTNAIEYLKQNRQYDSLKEAFASIRKGQPDEMPNENALEQTAKLAATDGGVADFFGTSVAISGDTAIVGSDQDDVGVNFDQGSAYIFVRSGTTWSQQQKLTASDGASPDIFGYSVAISGDTVIVGAPPDDVGANTDQGSAYVFVRSGTTWTEQQKLTAGDGAAGDTFGSSVAISGETIIVGAVNDDVGGNTDQGSAYVFVRSGTTWSQQQKLTASLGRSSMMSEQTEIKARLTFLFALGRRGASSKT
jgi:hypothetical protein